MTMYVCVYVIGSIIACNTRMLAYGVLLEKIHELGYELLSNPPLVTILVFKPAEEMPHQKDTWV